MGILQGLTSPVERGTSHGGAAASPLPNKFGGLSTTDSLIVVHAISDDLVTNVDVTSEASIPTNGRIQLTTRNTTGEFVVALWKKAV